MLSWTGFEVSIAAGSGFGARLHLGRFVGWCMERLGLGMRLCWGVLIIVWNGWNLEFETGTGFLDAAGWVVNGWCMQRS